MPRGLVRIETRDGGHTYELDGEPCPGVTTLLKSIAKPALVPWAAGVVAKAIATMPFGELDALRAGNPKLIGKMRGLPRTESKAAADRGRRVHTLAEELIAGKAVSCDDPELVPYAQSVVAFMNEWRPAPVLVEAIVGNREHRYCGTVDLICDLPDGRRALMDYKTARSGIYPETAMQLAAYRSAEFVVLGSEIPEEFPLKELGINCAYAVWIKPDGYEVRPVNTGPEVFEVFLSAAHTTRSEKAMKSWIGEPETWKAVAA